MKKTLLQHMQERMPQYSKDKLYAMILCGQIRYDGEILKQPGQAVVAGRDFEVLLNRYVSRGGEKLKGLIDLWKLDFHDKVVLDGGSSTGGFTHCVLEEGAALVYAVDVGYNQLDYRMRSHRQVVVMERTNIMKVHDLEPQPHVAVADLSFRSIAGAAEHMMAQLQDKRLYALIKPQFEIEKRDDFKGIVSDPKDWRRILKAVAGQLQSEDLGILRCAPSVIKGRKGNQEFFFEIAPLEECNSNEEQYSLIDDCLEGIPG